MEELTTRINRIAHELFRVENALRKIKKVSGTKEEKRKLAEDAWIVVTEKKLELDHYRNAFEPFVIGDEKNSVNDELYRIKEDIGEAMYLNAKGDTEGVDKLLFSIKERL